MKKDVFISYASEDRETADKICDSLESGGITCWIAHRDIQSGESYSRAIMDGIDHARVFILVFSKNADKSPHILRELQHSVEKNLTIIPFFIDHTKPNPDLKYFLGTAQREIATSPPLEGHIDRILKRINDILEREPGFIPPLIPPKPVFSQKYLIPLLVIVAIGAMIILLPFITNIMNSIVPPPTPTPTLTPIHTPPPDTPTPATPPPTPETPTPTPETGTKVSGYIRYNNDLITKYTPALASVELFDRNANTVVKDATYDPATGRYIFSSVPPGKYTPFVTVEDGYPFDRDSGGDYLSWISGLNPDITVAPYKTAIQADLKVFKSIHLVKPVDNQEFRTNAGDPPETMYGPGFAPSAELFEWEAVPGAASYTVTILLKDDSTGTTTSMVNTQVTSTEYRPGLSPNLLNQHYMFSVEASSSKDEKIGYFDHFYKNGHGGWFEFTLVSHP